MKIVFAISGKGFDGKLCEIVQQGMLNLVCSTIFWMHFWGDGGGVGGVGHSLAAFYGGGNSTTWG